MNDFNIESFQSLNPIEFENLVATLLLKMGFNASTTKTSGDGGIDIIATNEQPIVGGKYVVQCKRYAAGNNIGEPVVRELYGVMHAENANKGILITTSDFSKQAVTFAQDKAIELINGNSLLALTSKYFQDWQNESLNNEDDSYEGVLKNEPTDFRGIEWGSNLDTLHDMIVIEETATNYKFCMRALDVKKFGNTITEIPTYCFDNRGRFFQVSINFSGKNNYESILNYLFKLHGKPEYILWHTWQGKQIEIGLSYDAESSSGFIQYQFKPTIEKWDVEETSEERQQRKQSLLSVLSGHSTVSTNKQKDQCVVVTVVYGSPSAPEVITLRHWRDETLSSYCLGRFFINIYYKVGPHIAHYIKDKNTLKRLFRKIFDRFVRLL